MYKNLRLLDEAVSSMNYVQFKTDRHRPPKVSGTITDRSQIFVRAHKEKSARYTPGSRVASSSSAAAAAINTAAAAATGWCYI